MKNLLLIIFLTYSFSSSGQTNNSSPYCAAPIVFHSAAAGAIKNVSIGTLSNTTGLIGSSTGYLYYNNLLAPTLYLDSAYTLSVTFDTVCHSGASCAGVTDASWYRIGIAFDTIPGYLSFSTAIAFDTIGSVGATSAPVTISFPITVPHTAFLGITRLRVVRWGVVPGDPSITPRLCDMSFTSGDMGEAEDYDLNISNTPPPPPNPSLMVSHASGSAYSIYPNPTTGMIHIAAPLQSPVAITNVLGQLICSFALSDNEINISALPSGIYYIKVSNAISVLQKI